MWYNDNISTSVVPGERVWELPDVNGFRGVELEFVVSLHTTLAEAWRDDQARSQVRPRHLSRYRYIYMYMYTYRFINRYISYIIEMTE